MGEAVRRTNELVGMADRRRRRAESRLATARAALAQAVETARLAGLSRDRIRDAFQAVKGTFEALPSFEKPRQHRLYHEHELRLGYQLAEAEKTVAAAQEAVSAARAALAEAGAGLHRAAARQDAAAARHQTARRHEARRQDARQLEDLFVPRMDAAP